MRGKGREEWTDQSSSSLKENDNPDDGSVAMKEAIGCDGLVIIVPADHLRDLRGKGEEKWKRAYP
jgi:hypothetical protein